MENVPGPISDRLRRMFPDNAQGYKPPADRNDSPLVPGPVPDNVGGYSLGRGLNMSDYRQEHLGAIHNAVEQIYVLQAQLRMASEQSDVVLGSVRASVGDSIVDSAQAAMGLAAGVKDRLEEIMSALNAASDSLNLYGQGL